MSKDTITKELAEQFVENEDAVDHRKIAAAVLAKYIR